MKTIFVYYSNSGSGDCLASLLREKGFEILKLETKRKIGKIGFFKMFFLGGRASFHRKSKLLPYSFNKDSYDRIIVGSPVWADLPSTPINAFLAQNDLSNKPLVFLFYSGSGECKKGRIEVKRRYPDAEVIDIKSPKENQEDAKAIASRL